MIVIVANHIPDAVRGKLKLWFIEPKPNVFVSGVKDSVAMKAADLVMSYCPESSGLLLFRSTPHPPGFVIHAKGTPAKSITFLSGLQLIRDKFHPPLDKISTEDSQTHREPVEN
ncbi:MAG: type I-E CRISPR-associated endoribonuclease Cas2e [Planctomycetia bacterium]|nr:type I-E CRISPR-associated endoribonuclease Cas2e [Planctomycetia bacterium]